MQAPDVLVLGGGGILGEAWMSAVLAGLEEAGRLSVRECHCYVGTSAGSIVAASLAAGLPPGSRLGVAAAAVLDDVPEEPAGRAAVLRQAIGTAAEFAGAAAAPLASRAFASTAGGGALLRRTLLRRVSLGTRSLAELGRMVEQTGARWDGRLRIVAVELETGRRVVFGAPGAPEISVAAAVEASCAIPGVFRPVSAAGHSYVDGGTWSPTNLDTAQVRHGDRVLCLNPTGSLRPAKGSFVGAFGPVSRGIAATEALVLRDRGATVTAVNPDAASAAAMGVDLMNPTRRDAVIEAGLAQGRRLGDAPGRQAA
jgi:NTE family protein